MNKQAYEKPVLRRVRLEVSTSVLSVCNTSGVASPKDWPTPGLGCALNFCYTIISPP
jgi:hypothetical protein